MSRLTLIEPTKDYFQALIDYRNEFPKSDYGIDGTSQLSFAKDMDSWLAKVEQSKEWQSIPDGWVPGIQYMAINSSGDIVGMLHLRLALNDYLLNYGGHIGYSVRPSQRRQGYATEMLALSLEKARKQGLKEVLVTCADSNLASTKVIEANRGVIEDKCFDESRNLLTRRYWVKL